MLVNGQWRGHGEASGLELDMENWIVYVVGGGRIARIEFFLDAAAARARYEELA